MSSGTIRAPGSYLIAELKRLNSGEYHAIVKAGGRVVATTDGDKETVLADLASLGVNNLVFLKPLIRVLSGDSERLGRGPLIKQNPLQVGAQRVRKRV